MRREPGGHSNRDRHCFMNSWPLSSTDDVGHVPKTGISQGTKENRREKESRFQLREGIKREENNRRGLKHKAERRVKEQHPEEGAPGSLLRSAGMSSLPMQHRTRKSNCSLPGSKHAFSRVDTRKPRRSLVYTGAA